MQLDYYEIKKIMIISFESSNMWQDSWGSLSITENTIFSALFGLLLGKKEGCKKLNAKTSFF